ncbi:MAG TPA: RNA-binding protein [Fervidicoccus fontis]|uniref:Exosome complex component Csl4 n=1 Tax=Fervidicoccus fontis TaxID=683846 RepID=A0A7C2UUE1_9CREN|nr:RNA-binding protein [Fervidicoccus fontis]
MSSDENIVVPGEELAVIEEFSPLFGAYSDENGYVRASLLGKVAKDILNKVIKVTPLSSRYLFPSIKDIVIGYVAYIKGEIAMINILRDGNFRPLTGPLAGFLHISQIGAEGKHISEHVAPGDLIKARVISSENPFQLSIKHPSLGVILASCSVCGAILKREGDKLICPRCGNVEKRKIASSYINLKLTD